MGQSDILQSSSSGETYADYRMYKKGTRPLQTDPDQLAFNSWLTRSMFKDGATFQTSLIENARSDSRNLLVDELRFLEGNAENFRLEKEE